MIERFAKDVRNLLETYWARAVRLSNDPLQQLLVMVRLLEEMAATIREVPNGSLFTAFTYEQAPFDEEIREITRVAMERWRVAVGKYPPSQGEIPPGPSIRKTLPMHSPALLRPDTSVPTYIEDGSMLSRQVAVYHHHLEVLFSDDDAPVSEE